MTTTGDGDGGVAQLRDLVSAIPDVTDSVVIERSGRSVVYAVPARTSAGERIRAQIPADVVLVSRLPRNASGDVEAAPLLRLPVLDAALLARAAAATGDQDAVADIVAAGQAHSDEGDAPAGPAAQFDGERLPARLPATLGRLLRAAVESRHCVRLHDGDEITEWSYPELWQVALRACGGLQAAGVRPGDRVAIAARELSAFVPAFWGAVLAGAVAIPVGVPDLQARETAAAVTRIAAAVSARALVTDVEIDDGPNADAPTVVEARGLLAAAEGLPVERASNDLAVGLLTSGSTGSPKIVGQTHAAVIANAAAASVHNRFGPQEVSLNWLPLDHVGGLVMFHIRDVYLKCEQIQVSTDMVLRDPLTWLDLIDRYRVTVTWAPNFAYQLVTARIRERPDRTWDLSCLRFLLNGGEAVIAAQGLDFLAALAPTGLAEDCMHPAWGMSETCSGVLYSDRFAPSRILRDAPHVPVGFPVPGCSVRIVGEDGAVLSHGVPGTLLVRGPMVTEGYLDDAEANKTAIGAGGWFDTGDLAVAGPDGIVLIGRNKDVIISGGRNVEASEIEAVVDEVPGVDRTWRAAMAIRDAHSTTDELAVVFVPDGSKPEEEVAELIRRAVVRHTRIHPAQVRPVSRAEIPRTAIGKPKRSAIRRALFSSAAEPAPKARTPVVHQVGLESTAWFSSDGQERHFVLVGGEDVVEPIRDRLRRGGHQTTVLSLAGDPSTDATARRTLRAKLAQAAATGKITDLVSVLGPASREDMSTEVERDCRLVSALLNALSHAEIAGPLAFRVVVGNPAGGYGGGVVEAAGALAACASRETTWLSAQLVVVGPGGEAHDALARELLSTAATAWEVSLDGGRRNVRTLNPVERHKESPSGLRRHGRYLVTGGLGGVGRHVCAHLLSEHEAHLLVIGNDEAERGDRLAALNRLRGLGRVTYLPVDVADEDALGTAVKMFEREEGAALDGVLHLAGELVSGDAADLSAAGIEDACYAKIRGAAAIAAALEQRPDAVEIYFTSAHSLIPAPGLGAYAAANRSLDAFAAERRRQGRRAWSIAWSRWGVPGMGQGIDGTELAAAGGLLTLSPVEGTAALELILAAPPGWYTVGLDISNPRLAHLRAGARPLEEIRVRSRAPGAPREVTVLDAFQTPVQVRVTAGAGGGAGSSQVDVRAGLTEIWRELLSLDSVAGSADFFELGGHSRMVPRMQHLIRERLGVALPAVMLFERPSLDELAEGVAELAAETR